MKRLKQYTIIGILFVLITGSLAHFLYKWSGSHALAGLFTPVSESIWEHMKLLFFPMLIYAFFMARRLKKDYPCINSSLCLGILAGTLLIPVLFYTYSNIWGRDIFILDIGTFIVSVLAAFFISYRSALSCKARSYAALLYILVCILFVCFLLFTYHPPALPIFADPCSNIYCVASGSYLKPYLYE